LAALHSKDPEAIKQAKADAIKAGYSNDAVGAIGRTPTDVFLFSKLPEADQRAILRQANDAEFEPYVTHAQMKIRAPMREERAGKPKEEPAPTPASAPRTADKTSRERSLPTAATSPPPPPPAPTPPRSTLPPPRGSTRADQLLQTSPLGGR
jgi:hypothetical protein